MTWSYSLDGQFALIAVVVVALVFLAFRFASAPRARSKALLRCGPRPWARLS